MGQPLIRLSKNKFQKYYQSKILTFNALVNHLKFLHHAFICIKLLAVRLSVHNVLIAPVRSAPRIAKVLC